MHSGKVLMANADVYTPWMSRGGDNAIFTFETIVANASAALTVRAYHKDPETTGDGAEVSLTNQGAAWATIGSSNLTQGTYQVGENGFTGFLEWVRFRITVSNPLVDAAEGDFNSNEVGIVLYRFLQHLWFNTPNA